MKNPFSHQCEFLLHVACREWSRSLARLLAPLNISASEARIMVLIMHNRGVIQSQLCKLLGAQPANMAPMVGRLTRQGWVDAFKRDGRSLQLQLTLEGQQLAVQVEALFSIHEGAIIHALPDELQEHVLPILTALSHPEH